MDRRQRWRRGRGSQGFRSWSWSPRCKVRGWRRARKNRERAAACSLRGQQHRVAVGADAVAEGGQLGSVEELQPPCRLLDLDPLAVDLEAIAPAAHLEHLVAARGRWIEQPLR